MTDLDRRLAWGGVVGPAAFVTAWALGGAQRDGYDATRQAISRLAELGTSSRGLMTAGFLTFGAGVLVAAPPLARRFGPGAGWAAAATAAATIGVAATPLDGDVDNLPHAVFAITGYATLAAVPLFGSRTLRRAGARRAATASVAVGIAAVGMLAASIVLDDPGLAQRAGLTVADVWLAVACAAIATGRDGSAPVAHGAVPGV